MNLYPEKFIVSMHKPQLIIALVGMPGSGKSKTAEFLSRDKKLPIVSFGDVVNDYINVKRLPHDVKTHRRVRGMIRTKYKEHAFAHLNKKHMEKALEKKDVIIVDGLRSWEEYEYLKKHFSHTTLVLVALTADKNTRYKRIKKRGFRSKLYGQERDLQELFETNMGSTIAYADYSIDNNGSLDDLYKKLEKFYSSITKKKNT